ncbi:hypothetical protein FBF25_01175 [Candidatus Saccharibacteria bacterium oral taxon 488]|jgi:hypothetical protein|nr:hypothetical protein FBF25_01175 [Candidatus Saccharibacteria bacterium oral taxon 488]QLF51671.1 hypothetical protein HW277_01185 [Candidatus Saccharibacteria bacterium oral taxon 488]
MSEKDRSIEQHHQPRLWGETTDPKEHNPKHFRYLVHAINPFAKMSATAGCALGSMEGFGPETSGDQSISMYKQPERIGDRVSASMSLIDQDHTATWGPVGLLLMAPEGNIVITSGADASARNNNRDLLIKQGHICDIIDPNELLNRTSQYDHNEVVALAEHEGHQLQTVGFFYKVTPKGEPVNHRLAQVMHMHADRLQLPIVEIPEPRCADSENKVHRTIRHGKEEESIIVSLDGYNFYLRGFDDMSGCSTYWMLDKDSLQACFASPFQFKEAVEFAVGMGELSDEDARHVLRGYEEADLQRKTPTAYYDKNGNFEKIEYFEGYGSEEYYISIRKTGYSARGNTIDARRFYGALLCDDQLATAGPIESPLSPADAEFVIKEAIGKLDPARAVELEKWHEDHKSVIERVWRDHVQSASRLSGQIAVRHHSMSNEPFQTHH